MFQATGIMDGRQRPAIMHAYGGAKAGMERSLATIAAEGLLPCLALQENRRCGPVWVSALLQEQPLTSRCYLPVFLKGKNYLYSLIPMETAGHDQHQRKNSKGSFSKLPLTNRYSYKTPIYVYI